MRILFAAVAAILLTGCSDSPAPVKKAESVPQERSILTATAREMQSFLLAHLEAKGAYFETAILKRKKT